MDCDRAFHVKKKKLAFLSTPCPVEGSVVVARRLAAFTFLPAVACGPFTHSPDPSLYKSRPPSLLLIPLSQNIPRVLQSPKTAREYTVHIYIFTTISELPMKTTTASAPKLVVAIAAVAVAFLVLLAGAAEGARGRGLARGNCDELYVVREGETLQTISARCDAPFILVDNPHIVDTDDVGPGTVLTVRSLGGFRF
ncbi:hypothetical protein H6P81_013230 [Aristolochia fimbriata]|uniref:LysM domain-containing protein n=1 Tax=Aristolochia fimbriata TaxID=158543 RepID=A0AAV7EHS2_ARIFI|nr:hypothetical protein H6P81_013230 [Aristolochia fimbriata]